MRDSLGTPPRWWTATGLFLFVLAVYVLTAPGRIDSIDGQRRFDVAASWLRTGQPILTDPWLKGYSFPGRGGHLYSIYGAAASVCGMPLILLGRLVSSPIADLFFFSLTSQLLGAAIAPLLYGCYRELGVSVRAAIGWALASSFTTLLWPGSDSTTDNAQHAFWALLAVYCGLVSARRNSAVFAVLGGLAAGVLLCYQQYFLIIMPALACATLSSRTWASLAPSNQSSPTTLPARTVAALRSSSRTISALLRSAWREPGEARAACVRYLLFLAGVGVGLVLYKAYNFARYDDGDRRVEQAAYASRDPSFFFGNPLLGFLSLVASPGKSVFLYSPPLLIGLLGFRRLQARNQVVATVVVGTSIPMLLFLSCVAFCGGDWCWGPRYLMPLVVLWALALPFGAASFTRARASLTGILAAGFLVQALGLSVVAERFFFDHQLTPYFWNEDPWCYFRRSALPSRVNELLSLREGPPPTAHVFNTTPIPEWSTYVTFGPPEAFGGDTRQWMQDYQVFFLPRPWPLWMLSLPLPLRAVDVRAWVLGLLAVAAAGAALISSGVRKAPGS